MKILDFFRKQQKLRIDLVKNINKLMKLKQKYSLPINVRLKKIETKEGKDIFLVDGNKIRKAIDIDFTMGGHGLRYVYIPVDEIWIDSSNEDELEEEAVEGLGEGVGVAQALFKLSQTFFVVLNFFPSGPVQST